MSKAQLGLADQWGLKESAVRLVIKVLLGALVWLAVSVLVGRWVGKALRARREQMEAMGLERPVLPDLQDSREPPEEPESRGLKAP